MLRTYYPPIEPYATGAIEVDGGHRVYFERCGTPGAKPAVFLHGGPGAGISPLHRRVFDPSLYDVTLFDQRGCGRSTPHARVEANTTWDLVADIERLREAAGVERWLVFGGSWGSTLALAYAQSHPDRVCELVLRGISTCTSPELHWLHQFGVSELFPDKYERLVANIPAWERGNLIEGYHRRVMTGSRDDQIAAARTWSLFEGEVATLLPEPVTSALHDDEHYAFAFARIELHYFLNSCWLEPSQLLRGVRKIRSIPCTIVHGRYDMPCPVRYAWELHKAWPEADFRLIEGAGHAFSEPGILDQLVRATDRYAKI
ncbi:prolyl aminopeptidase [uncultured Caballeronia sp.]|uniref:prolyl aminopeptidase n=1 Tax=uncultured Caballeronia sp. TaxID=1827198 RepID=UPI001576D0D5